MTRGTLALGGGLLVAAVVVLYVMLRSSDGTEMTRDATGPKITEADPGKPSSRLRPLPPSEPAQTDGSSSGSARDYTIGGVRVRDHRSGEHAQLDIPPAVHPPHGRRIPSQLTYDLTQRLRGVVNECAASVPQDGRGDKPRVDGEILIAIKNQRATVTAATFQLRDAAPTSEAAVKACVEQKAVGVAAPSGDEAELENYAITLSVRLP
jgi:hypothetical protein